MTAQIKPGIKELSDETGAPAAIEDVCDNRGPAVKGRGGGLQALTGSSVDINTHKEFNSFNSCCAIAWLIGAKRLPYQAKCNVSAHLSHNPQ